jgi:hypothetical protein
MEIFIALAVKEIPAQLMWSGQAVRESRLVFSFEY